MLQSSTQVGVHISPLTCMDVPQAARFFRLPVRRQHSGLRVASALGSAHWCRRVERGEIIGGQFNVDRGDIYPTEAVLVPVVRREVFRERLTHDVAGTTMLPKGHRVELFIDGLRQPDLANL